MFYIDAQIYLAFSAAPGSVENTEVGWILRSSKRGKKFTEERTMKKQFIDVMKEKPET